MEVELEQRILEAEQIRYAAGVVSNAQIVAQQERLAVVEQEYSKALLDYSLGFEQAPAADGHGSQHRGVGGEGNDGWKPPAVVPAPYQAALV